MAKTFMDMKRAGLVEGLFLSSGIIGGGILTQEKITDTAEILRHKYNFRGYVHLKIMPGSEKGQVERAMRLANRLSVNLEAPNSARLHTLAPLKNFEQELLRPLHWIEEIRHSQPARGGWNGRWPSSTTQFVVGGGYESDLELLSTVEYLFSKLKLRRTYFSAFRPVPDTPLENLPAEDPLRQHRLYQASYLFRDYGFDLEELPFSQDGNLPRELDPKHAWAEQHLLHEPLEVNDAGPQELLRVPGVGPKSAKTIMQARRQGALRALPDLRKLGVRTAPMEPYVLLDGKRPSRQLRLFP
jgi:predicted DNA-binding helix-hairpin-helix protein